jgi:hypothetical protein
MSMAFVKGGKSDPNKQKWIETVGTYYYYCLILSNFNPNVAEQIFDNPAHIIAQSWVSKVAYEHVEAK